MSQTNEESGTVPSPTQPSVFNAEVRSPTAPWSFSQAETVLTSGTHYTANTGGRARQSCGNNIGGFWRTPSFLSNENNRSTSYKIKSMVGKCTNNVSSPISGTSTATPAIELPASLVASPKGPRSFFDSDSESEGEPVLSRASSVRVQRPQLVEHNSSTKGCSLRVHNASLSASRNSGHSSQDAGQVLEPPYTIFDSALQAQGGDPNDVRPGSSISKAQQLLGVPSKNVADATPAVEEENAVENPGGPAEALKALNANAVDGASTTPLAPTPFPKSDMPYPPASIMEIPNPPPRVGALSTLPSPMGGLGTLRVPHGHVLELATRHTGTFRQPKTSVMDGLRTNPIRDSDVSRLHRTISAPPLPSHHPHRKMSIRPLDLEVAGEHGLRQSVVNTPYPTGAGSPAMDVISPLSAIASTKVGQAVLLTSEERERFPSPARREILYLELAVARHVSMTTLVQITVEDRSTYDDEALFRVLQRSYRQKVVGLVHCLVTARALRGVTFTDPVFDATSFLQHLLSPKRGRKRKTWLLWLREHQIKHTSSVSSGSGKSVAFHSPASTPRMPFFKMNKAYPRLTFHFEFSLPKVALATVGTIILSCLAAILWVLFGVPGIGLSRSHRAPVMPLEEWKLDAQGRVLTGLVLGVLVALLGALGGAGWLAGSWLLL